MMEEQGNQNSDEESVVHDQLPTLQEVHAKSATELDTIRPHEDLVESKRKKLIKSIAAFFFLAALVSSIVALLVVFENGTRSNATTYNVDSSDMMGSCVSSGITTGSDGSNAQAFKILYQLSLRSNLIRTGSPQYLAAKWMLTDDTQKIPIPSDLSEGNCSSRFVNRYVLAVLYFALDGPSWARDYHFLSDKDECNWHINYFDVQRNKSYNRGALCRSSFSTDDGDGSYDDELVAITLPNNLLQGSLPAEIGFLTSLQEINFDENQLSRSLPLTMISLQNLRYAFFANNLLEGTIPNWLGSLKKLRGLYMVGNLFNGSLPNELGKLTKLELLSFSANDLSGSLPDSSWDSLENLQYIFFTGSGLNGTIPSWVGYNRDLKDFRISNNMFSSTIPNSFAQLENLESLFLDDNILSGDLQVTESLNNLEKFMVEDNAFEQTLDATFLSGLTRLQFLDASNNNLKGYIAKNMFLKTELRVLDLHGNEIGGTLPEFPDNDRLQYLSLYQNKMFSTIPASIGNLKGLIHLDISTNTITGFLPEEIGELKDLVYLFLAMNNFDPAPMPTFLLRLTKLKELSLKGTSRTGNIPDWIGNLKGLILLDLDYNQLDGTIPASIDQLTGLLFLLLNRNQLTGIVPATLQKLSQLRILLIENNDLSGLGKGYSEFCENIPHLGREGTRFTSDCGPPAPKLNCTCCTECCGEGIVCNDGHEYLANQDLVWENGYQRMGFTFSEDTKYVLGDPLY